MAKANETAAPMTMEEMQEKIASLESELMGRKGPAAAPAASSEPSENEARMREPVEIRLFKDNGKYKDDVFVAVNGKAWQIKRGETVKVPRYVKEVLDSSISQDQYAAKFAEGLADTYESGK